MLFRPTLSFAVLAVVFAALSSSAAAAEQPIVDSQYSSVSVDEGKANSIVQRASRSMQGTIDDALDLVGIRYKKGGNSVETGFDCSGFVGHVFRESVGLILPRTSKEISRTGETVERNQLKPGDLVFFNTVKKTFSHVGIYLGNNQFIHSPRTGGRIRIEDMSEGYWVKRYNGARRVNVE